MLDQLLELAKQYGSDAVVKNNAIPNEKNDDVIKETGISMLSGLQEMATGGNLGDLAGLLSGKSKLDSSNPVVKQLTKKVSNNLGEKFNLPAETTNSVASNMIPKILGGLLNKAKDPKQKGFNIEDLVGSISGGKGGDLMEMVTKYGGAFGLDQNGDGKVDLQDAISALSGNAKSKKGGLGGLLGGLFGKK